jgi:hypothetical protein
MSALPYLVDDYTTTSTPEALRVPRAEAGGRITDPFAEDFDTVITLAGS